MINKIGTWLWHQWDMSDGRLLQTRYKIGRLHERLFGYEPDCDEWPYRLAHWMGLSGYSPSATGWAKRFYEASKAETQ